MVLYMAVMMLVALVFTASASHKKSSSVHMENSRVPCLFNLQKGNVQLQSNGDVLHFNKLPYREVSRQ